MTEAAPRAPALRLRVIGGRLAMAQLEPGASAGDGLPAGGPFAALVRRGDELSLVCAESAVPPGAVAETGFRALEVEGPLDFSATGVLASIAAPLAAAGIPVLALSTFDTDVILVREAALGDAAAALVGAGHAVET